MLTDLDKSSPPTNSALSRDTRYYALGSIDKDLPSISKFPRTGGYLERRNDDYIEA